jgi:hypothetical protein
VLPIDGDSRQMRKFSANDRVTVHLGDFTSCGSCLDMNSITHVLLDPSCSGSGIINQAGLVGEEEEAVHTTGVEEVTALADEQTKLVLHAMTLPRVNVIVYSTCSVHREEDEDVVRRVLEGCNGKFVQVMCMPDWPHRGLEACGEIGRKSCRAGFDKGCTNGFFVSRFERKGFEVTVDDRSGAGAGVGDGQLGKAQGGKQGKREREGADGEERGVSKKQAKAKGDGDEIGAAAEKKKKKKDQDKDKGKDGEVGGGKKHVDDKAGVGGGKKDKNRKMIHLGNAQVGGVEKQKPSLKHKYETKEKPQPVVITGYIDVD